MTFTKSVASALILTALFGAQAFASPNILQDGTFLQPIGTDSNLTPWSDWTGAGIKTFAGGPGGSNYAAIPVGGDLFQRFSALGNGAYQISFDVRNESSAASTLVFSVQQILGTPMQTVFDLGFGAAPVLQAASGWQHLALNFNINSPNFPVNEFYFSNSYNAPTGPIANSINRAGTIIDVANVKMVAVTTNPGQGPLAVPGPIAGAGLLPLAALLLIGRWRRRRNTSRAHPPA